MRRLALLLLLAAGPAACARPPLELPDGPSRPLANPAPLMADAFAGCDTVRTLTAELGMSGRVGSQRIRGRLLAGFARPDAVRLEGLAPFGEPIFILAGRGGRATLWMPREGRVLSGADPAAVIEALAGVAVPPDDLRAWLAGCPGTADWTGARQYREDWVALQDQGRQVWLRRQDGAWRLAAIERGSVIVEIQSEEARQPTGLRIRKPDAGEGPPVDLSLDVRGVETNVDLTDAAFTVNVPPDAVEISLEELRRSGPLRDLPPDETAAAAPRAGAAGLGSARR